MTKNMGTAAYMAPELTSLTDYARDFSQPTPYLDPDQRDEREHALASQHVQAMSEFDLSSTDPTPHSVRSNSTDQNLAPKVRWECFYDFFVHDRLESEWR